jgi:hypothetical protein
MSSTGAPFRFLGLVTGGWASARFAWIWQTGSGLVTGAAAVTVATVAAPPVVERVSEVVAPPAEAAKPKRAVVSGVTVGLDQEWAASSGSSVAVALDSSAGSGGLLLASRSPSPGFSDAGDPYTPPPAAPAAPPSWRPGRSRLSGSAWMFLRGMGSPGVLASGGQLGGSQAGARLAYRITGEESAGLSVVGRYYAPIPDDSGAEAALGLEWQPWAKVPVRLGVERRFKLGPQGRNAWSAYAAGGFYRILPGRVELDGYGQAGVVGTKQRDLFVDGAVRAGKQMPVGRNKTLILGGGVWGAAQPGVSRLDLGPRAALRMPVKRATVTAAVEGRMRVAGNAMPGSTAALTLAADF